MANNKVLGVITARGGSKTLPGKNIKILGDKPLLAWTIESAKKSKIFDRIILSTDDEEISNVGLRFGAEAPFKRPAELAGDKVPSLPVIIHACKYLRDNEKYISDYVMILQPTSPFRRASDIIKAYELIESTGADSVVGVSFIPEAYNPARAMRKESDGFLKLWNGKPVKERIARRQDLSEAFHSTTVIYLFKTSLLFEENPSLYGEKVAPLLMEEPYTLDIDDINDFNEAERLLKENKIKL